MNKFFLLSVILFCMLAYNRSNAQGVAINSDNSSPDPSAILDIKSSEKGVLFPRISRAERDAIQNPADGLHIFNSSSGSLEYYDSVFKIWVPYCNNCSYFSDTLKFQSNDTIINYQLPQEASSYLKIILVISPGVNVVGTTPAAIDLSTATTGSSIIIKNYGNIIGGRGRGGGGGDTGDANCPIIAGRSGFDGGNAIASKSGTTLTVYNYGIIGGGGGGGGGGGAGYYSPDCGGGGGTGAGGHGIAIDGGIKGLPRFYAGWGCSYGSYSLASNGQDGTYFSFGSGGNGGQSGSPLFAGYAGGNGGSLGQPGQAGYNSYYSSGGPGGLPGKAISGNAGNNTAINQGGGVVYGVID